MKVRPAGANDLGAVVELEEECFGDDAWPASLIEPGLNDEVPTVTYFVAVEDQQIVGYAVLSLVVDVAELQRIGVNGTHRRHKVGSSLLAAVLEEASTAERLLLEVREDNTTAIDFYQAHGFIEIDRRRGYYRDGVTAVVLGKWCLEDDRGESQGR